MKRKDTIRKGLAAFLACVTFFGQTVYAQEIISAQESAGYEMGQAEELHPNVWKTPEIYDVSKEEAQKCALELQSEDVQEYAGNYIDLLFLLEEKVKNAILAGETEVSLLDMRISKNKYNNVWVDDFSPYIGEAITIQTYQTQDYYHSIKITNNWTQEETERYFFDVDKKLEEVLNLVTDEMSDLEKALIIHDYLAEHAEYDMNEVDVIPRISFRSGGVLMKGVGVCQSYANAYQYILNRLGIECWFAMSNSMEMPHGWNIVKIGDSYYHVDCTWDDPISDMLGQVKHRNFLSSDERIKAEGHDDWEIMGRTENLVCSDKRYDEAFWHNATSPIILNGGYAYYTEFDGTTSRLYKRKFDGGDAVSMKDMGHWQISGTSYIPEVYSGLFLHKGFLYYNTSEEIRRISLDGTKDVVVFHPGEVGAYLIYGIRKQGGDLQYLLALADENSHQIQQKGIFTAPVDLAIHPNKVILNPVEMEMEVGDNGILQYSLEPVDAIADVTLTSSNPSVAKVNEVGHVTAVAPGEAVITVTADDCKAECKIRVNEPLPFQDVSRDWTFDGIAYVYRHGEIMKGKKADSFSPLTFIPRAEFATTLYRLSGDTNPMEYQPVFPDVKMTDWFWEEVLWANQNKIINGYTATHTFGPNDNVTREQMAVMMYRYAAEYKGYNTDKKVDLEKFKDADRVSGFAKTALSWAVGTGIITGKDNGTKLDPQGNASRAECAIILMRFMENYQSGE